MISCTVSSGPARQIPSGGTSGKQSFLEFNTDNVVHLHLHVTLPYTGGGWQRHHCWSLGSSRTQTGTGSHLAYPHTQSCTAESPDMQHPPHMLQTPGHNAGQCRHPGCHQRSGPTLGLTHWRLFEAGNKMLSSASVTYLLILICTNERIASLIFEEKCWENC